MNSKSFFFLPLLLVFVANARAETLRVPDGVPDIQSAIAASHDGDVILVAAGEYQVDSPIDFGGRAITLKADADRDETTLRMSSAPADPELAAVVVFASDESASSVLEGFTVTGGQGVRWGEEDIKERGGGGLYCALGAKPRIIGCRFTGNSAQIGAGALVVSGAAPTFLDCEFSDNTALFAGGAAAFFNASPTLRDCVFRDNLTFGQGGGLFFTASDLDMERCSIVGNLAQGASAIGGGILVGGGSSGRMGDCLIQNNACVGDFGNGGGGAIIEENTRPTLDNCRIEENFGGIGGGLDIALQASPTLKNCRIIGNMATHGFGGGGLRCWQSSPVVESCVVAGNSTSWGGGIQCFQGTPQIINSLVVGNVAEAGGGGVQCSQNSTARIVNSTIANNVSRSEEGAGVNCFASTPVLINSVVWANDPPSACGDVSNSITEDDPLFVEAGTFQFDRFREVEIGGLPRLLPNFIEHLGDYGIRSGSPAIDAADPTESPPEDLLGASRCQGPDIGAFEHQTAVCSSVPFRRGDVEVTGSQNIGDAVATLNFLFLGAEPPACLKAADANDDGDVDISDPVFLLLYLFQGGLRPVAPFDACGLDDTEDELPCAAFECL